MPQFFLFSKFAAGFKPLHLHKVVFDFEPICFVSEGFENTPITSVVNGLLSKAKEVASHDSTPLGIFWFVDECSVHF